MATSDLFFLYVLDFLKARFVFRRGKGKNSGENGLFLGYLAPFFLHLYFGRRCVGILTN